MNQAQSKVMPIKYKNETSIKKIKAKYIIIIPFSFRPVTPQNVVDVISTLHDAKLSGEILSGDIPLRILKENKIFLQVSCKQINNFLKTGAFSYLLNLAETIPIHKQEDPFDKDYYRPISILPLISKILEKIICSQVYSFTQQYF